MDAERLQSVPLFSDLTRRQLEQIAQWMDEVDLPAGKELLGRGSFAYEFVIIESGSASVSIEDRHVNDLGAGDFFGGIALLERPRRTASVQATSPKQSPAPSVLTRRPSPTTSASPALIT